MSRYRNNLPQLGGDLFITDGGIETVMVFHHGYDLPEFASFTLLDNAEATKKVREYFGDFTSLATQYGVGLILEALTWRASSSWGKKIGYEEKSIDQVNRDAIKLLTDIRDGLEKTGSHHVVSGAIGPRSDGYRTVNQMSETEAEDYHSRQVATLAQTDADMVCAYTIPYVEEGIGIARAAKRSSIPSGIGFTVETDGRLPSGQDLGEAIMQVDDATNSAPAYFMVNCAHATHFEDVLGSGEDWTKRIRAVRANASTKSHAELDESETLDDGNPVEFGQDFRRLREKASHVNVLGGCCGTDKRHIEEICKACLN